jgi:hypothetical protein
MRLLIALLLTGTLAMTNIQANAQTIAVASFHKVIICPYIQATFVQGDKESITVNSAIVDNSKLHVDDDHGTLRIYLEGAREIPHNQQNRDLYPRHAIILTVTYKKLDGLSLRGEEKYLCESPLSEKNFSLRVYGEGTVIFTQVHFAKLFTTLYGESTLDIRSGEINKQYYTCYGEGKVNTTAISGQAAKVTAFGEAEFKVNVSHRIKITSFGEAKLCYLGSPTIVKGIHFGEVGITKLD